MKIILNQSEGELTYDSVQRKDGEEVYRIMDLSRIEYPTIYGPIRSQMLAGRYRSWISEAELPRIFHLVTQHVQARSDQNAVPIGHLHMGNSPADGAQWYRGGYRLLQQSNLLKIVGAFSQDQMFQRFIGWYVPNARGPDPDNVAIAIQLSRRRIV